MKFILSIFVTLFFSTAALALPQVEVSEADLITKMKLLTTMEQAQRQQYYIEALKALGYSYTPHAFKLGYASGLNLVFEKKGSSPTPKTVLIGAHYDRYYSGADDNTSGSIGALIIATSLAKTNFKNTIQVVFFDHEESGLVGSSIFVREVLKPPFAGAFTMDMIGYDSNDDGGMEVQVCAESGEASHALAKLMINTIQTQNLFLKPVIQCNRRSDQGSFWRAGLPAVNAQEKFFTGDSTPCYHQACDTWDTINYKYLANMIRLVGYSAMQILEPVP
ncbi:MAG: M28 family metallopeptidase [Bdellovibrionales bacterium]